jgi:hypothetical protein
MSSALSGEEVLHFFNGEELAEWLCLDDPCSDRGKQGLAASSSRRRFFAPTVAVELVVVRSVDVAAGVPRLAQFPNNPRRLLLRAWNVDEVWEARGRWVAVAGEGAEAAGPKRR